MAEKTADCIILNTRHSVFCPDIPLIPEKADFPQCVGFVDKKAVFVYN